MQSDLWQAAGARGAAHGALLRVERRALRALLPPALRLARGLARGLGCGLGLVLRIGDSDHLSRHPAAYTLPLPAARRGAGYILL